MTPEQQRLVAILRYLEDWDKLTGPLLQTFRIIALGSLPFRTSLRTFPTLSSILSVVIVTLFGWRFPALRRRRPPYLLRACCHGSYLRTILQKNLVTETASSFLVKTIRKRVKRLNSMIKRTFNNHSMSIFANSGTHGRTVSKSGGVAFIRANFPSPANHRECRG
jgi:hypothetical protein